MSMQVDSKAFQTVNYIIVMYYSCLMSDVWTFNKSALILSKAHDEFNVWRSTSCDKSLTITVSI